MDPTLWELICEVLGEAIELPPRERHAYVADKSPSPEIAAAVFRLLDKHGDSETFLDHPPFAGVLQQATHQTLFVNEQIAGRFTVVRFLGAGGMGEVYEVLDTELGERIALKTIRFAPEQEQGMLHRFRREVQLARRVTHRNVCRLHDFGRCARREGADLLYFTSRWNYWKGRLSARGCAGSVSREAKPSK
ncbi:MAG: hypothetical protein HY820_05185 [Acidobacteria bacterium]|nr:hypothetical protein [Acidobacteriota bacterium]